MSDSRIDAAIAEYLQAAEAGTPLDRAAWLEKHANLRAELEQFLADQSAFRNVARPNEQLTLPLRDMGVDGSHPIVRYFGDYELLEEIARGGMGVVYKARQVSLNRPVAVKMILTGQLASAADVQRFKTEAEAAANLDHPNILPIYEVGEHEGQHYFSMKLIDGGSLSDAIRNKTLTTRRSVELLEKVARAVHYAHQRGILHRDLKPANVLLDKAGTPYVTDFGLAKKVEGDSALTHTGAILGTPSYMAPEQARSEKVVSTAVDVYSLGAILYEILTGQPPFRAHTPFDTVLQVLDQDPAYPRNINPTADRDLSIIALKCLEKDPERRYGFALALAEELGRWLADLPIQARPVSFWERYQKWARRRPTMNWAFRSTIAATFVIVVSGAIGAFMLGAELLAIYLSGMILASVILIPTVFLAIAFHRETAPASYPKKDSNLTQSRSSRKLTRRYHISVWIGILFQWLFIASLLMKHPTWEPLVVQFISISAFVVAMRERIRFPKS